MNCQKILIICTFVQDERGRLMRRTIVRYVCLCLTMVLTMISPRVKKRFPDLNNLIEAGLLLENEKTILDNLNVKFPKPSKHWYVILRLSFPYLYCSLLLKGRCRPQVMLFAVIRQNSRYK